MRKIVVPTDFSTTSASALRYATFIAEVGGYAMEVVHIHDGYGHSEDPKVRKGDLAASMSVKVSLDQFIRFNVTPAHFTGEIGEALFPAVKIREEIGAPDAVLQAISKEADTSMIIMGGVGSGNVSATSPVFGSTAKSVALNAECPVMLIPRDHGMPQVENAAIAFGNVVPLQETYDKADFLLSLLSPSLRFVHVQDSKENRKGQAEIDALAAEVDARFTNYPFELDVLPPANVAKALLSYSTAYDVDLLIVGRRKRGLLGRLFLRSEVSPLMEATPCPMLIVPISNY